MKILLLYFSLLLTFTVNGQQSRPLEVDTIDRMVEKTPKLSSQVITNFVAKKASGHIIKYRYIVTKTGIVKLTRSFKEGQDSIVQEFYFNFNKLIFGKEVIYTFLNKKDKKPSIFWAGYFYFKKDKLIYHITTGHGKSELEEWEPDREWKEYYQEVRKHLKERSP